MMIFVTPQDIDKRFVIYLKTSACKIIYNFEGLIFESSLPHINIMKDFLINYGVRELEVREDGQNAQLLVHDKEVYMQFDDLNTISGLKVPVLTVI